MNQRSVERLADAYFAIHGPEIARQKLVEILEDIVEACAVVIEEDCPRKEPHANCRHAILADKLRDGYEIQPVAKEPKAHKVHFITSEDGDWIGLYFDGELLDEGHSLDERQVVRRLAQKRLGLIVTTEEKSAEWFEEQGGSCPPHLEGFK
jgi:hypothetical protein